MPVALWPSKIVKHDYNSVTPNVKIRRTCLKNYRNPNNRPDKTDKEVMYRLEDTRDFKPIAVDMGSSYESISLYRQSISV